MDRHTMAPQVQVGTPTRVPSRMIVIVKRTMWLLIAKRTVWLIIDTLPPLRQGTYIKVQRRMNYSQGIGEIIIDTILLLRQGAKT